MSPRISRYFVGQPLVPTSGPVRLDRHAANYFSRTLRLKPGDAVVLFDGAGEEWLARITRLTRSDAELALEEELETIQESFLEITLVQGLSKSDAMDQIVRKCTELGVARILPAFSKFSVVKLDAERSQRRKAHWESVAQAACNQSGRHFAPEISSPTPLANALEAGNAEGLKWILDPSGERMLDQAKSQQPPGAIVAVGPEGGFSEGELALAKTLGFKPVRLGPRTMRADTAAVVAIALVQSLFGDMGAS